MFVALVVVAVVGAVAFAAMSLTARNRPSADAEPSRQTEVDSGAGSRPSPSTAPPESSGDSNIVT